MGAIISTFGERTVPNGASMVSAAELRRNFGVWQERALAAPVVIVRHGRPRLVLSAADSFYGPRTVDTRAAHALHSALAGVPEHMSEGLLVLDREFRIAAVNQACAEMMGREAGELVGRVWQEAMPEAAERPVTIWLRHVLRAGSAVHLETTSPHEPQRHFLVTIYPHGDGVAALAYNKTAERVLVEEVREHRTVSETLNLLPNAGYLKINPRGLVCSVGPQVPKLLGYDPSAPRRAVVELAAAEDGERLREGLEQVLSGGGACRLSLALRAASGRPLPVDLALSPIDGGRTIAGAVGVFHARA